MIVGLSRTSIHVYIYICTYVYTHVIHMVLVIK